MICTDLSHSHLDHLDGICPLGREGAVRGEVGLRVNPSRRAAVIGVLVPLAMGLLWALGVFPWDRL